MFLLLGVLGIFLIGMASADCSLGVSLLNQNPYPAATGGYVQVVFQVTGLNDPACGTASFNIVPNFPFSVDPGTNTLQQIVSGTFTQNYQSTWMLPYELRVDNNAINGNNPIEVRYGYNVGTSNPVYYTQQFNISVNNTQTDFHVVLNGYSYSTNVLALDLVNTGDNDAQAVTIQIPSQPGVQIIGPDEQVVGSLNANDDTTVNFNAIVTGQNVTAIITYNDVIGIRRTVQKVINFSPDAYSNTKPASSQVSFSAYLLIITWILIIIFFVYRYYKNRKIKKMNLRNK